MFDNKVRDMSRKRSRESVIPVVSTREDGKYSVELWPIRNSFLEIVEDRGVLKRLKRRSSIHGLMRRMPPLWYFYAATFRWIYPVWEQITRKDEEKSLIRRILGLNLHKFKSLFKV